MMSLVPHIQKITRIHWFILFAILFVIRIGASFIEFLNVDEFDYFLSAQSMLQGGQFYHDFFNSRYTGLFFHALAQWIFPTGNTLGAHWLGILCLAGSLYLLVDACRKTLSDHSAFYIGISFAIFPSVGQPEFHAILSETVANFFIVLSVWFFINGYFKKPRSFGLLFLTGVSLVIAGHGKQPAILMLLGYGIYLFIELIRGVKAPDAKGVIFAGLSILGGFVVFFVLVLILHIPLGVFDYYYIGMWIGVFFYYIPSSFDSTMTDAVPRFASSFGQIVLYQFVLWVGFVWLIIRFIREKSIPTTLLLIFILWMVSFLLFFLGGDRFYLHYELFSVPFLCVIGGYWVSTWGLPKESGVNQRRKINGMQWFLGLGYLIPFLVTSVLYLGLAIYILASPNHHSRDQHMLFPSERYGNMLAYLNTHTDPSDYLCVWGEEIALHYYSRTKMAIHQLWCGYYQYYPEDKLLSDETPLYFRNLYLLLLKNLEEHQPKWFVDTSTCASGIFNQGSLDRFPMLKGFVNKHYAKEIVLDTITLYRWKSAE